MHNKRNYNQGEKIILRMRENNNKYTANIKTAHGTQYQENKQPNQKVRKRPKQAFVQRRNTDG